MTDVRELVIEIITDFTKLQNSIDPIPDRNDDFSLPSMIPAGKYGAFIVSKKIERDMASIGRVIKNERRLNSRFGQIDWDRALRRAFGQAFAKIDLRDKLSDNADLVLRSVQETLHKYEANTRKPYEHAFGCTLFSDDEIKPFNIGPVSFENRSDWLKGKKDAGAISPITYRRICKTWQGQKLKSRRPSKEHIHESSIIDTIKYCPFVCSVATEGLAQYISKEKALTAARISMASIALLWAQPSQALEGFNLLFDGPVHSETSLIFLSGNLVLSSYETGLRPHGPFLEKGEWEKIFREHENIFNVIGEVLEFYLKPLKESARPNIMNTLFHALLWFQEGCRESLTTLSIVKFASCMDALACGKKSKGILNIIEARLGIKPGDRLLTDGTTAKQAINKIYEYARSRTLHGTNEKIGEDWSSVRGDAEQIARLCLLVCINWAGSNLTCNDPLLFSQR